MEAAAVPNPITVVIADDHRLFAEALEAILVTEERIRVVGQARDGAEAVELAERVRPDVVLMDISMPGMDGIEATRRIAGSGAGAAPAVLMLTGSNARLDVDRARKAGAAGYVTKDRIAAELIEAILNAAGG